MKIINSLAAVTAVLLAASNASADVFNVQGVITDLSTNAGATLTATPLNPSFTGTYDDATNAFSFNVQGYDLNVLVVPVVLEADIVLTAGTVSATADGASPVTSTATVASCTGAAVICGSVGTPPITFTAALDSWDGANGAITTTSTTATGSNFTTYTFSEVVGVPPSGGDSVAIPVMPLYGILATVFGLLVVGLRRLRKLPGR